MFRFSILYFKMIVIHIIKKLGHFLLKNFEETKGIFSNI